MKHFKYILLGMTLALSTSCQKDFLQLTPDSAITDENFFNTVKDLETYTNGLYGQIRASYTDLFSDNISLSNNTQNADVRTMLSGTLSPSNATGWDNWSELREINYMLDHVEKTVGEKELIDHYVGIARFFRANFYYNMVKRYGDVPWYDHVIGSKDDEQLYKGQDPREQVVEHIMEDLDFAVNHIKADLTDNTYITKWAALTLLARIALHEGTFRKYHTELNLQSSADAFLQKAVDASAQIINEGGFEISGAGAQGFSALFSSNNLSDNKEVIYLQKNSKDLGVANNTHTVLDWQWALSADLADEFLMLDGTPFTDQKDYQKKDFIEMFANRDPRLAETVMPAGFSNSQAGNPYITRPEFGGLLQLKFYPRDPALRGGWELNYTDLPIFRYAEVLLINAEAKAELSTLSQGDLDATVNKLRQRVDMPKLSLAKANSMVDQHLAKKYPLVAGANKGVLLEIRRERRVELACEGFRFDDLYRWKAGELLAQASSGMYVPALGALDVTGDGKADIAILKQGDESPLDGLPAEIKESLPKFFIDVNSFYLSEGNSGRIMFNDDKVQRPRNFDASKYYYFPIPIEQTVLNTNLKQPEGWN